MNNLKYVIFDFDGTIASTVEMALDIYNQLAPKYKCRQIEMNDLSKLSAENGKIFFAEYGVNKFKLFLLVLHIREEMKKQIESVKPFEGIISVIHEFKKAGFKLGIVTSNARKNVLRFLDNHALKNYFSFVYSGNSFFGKEKVLRRLLATYRIIPENVVYIGDETRDITASHKTGIHIVSVSWGLTPARTLKAFNPFHVVDNPRELPEIVSRILNR